MIEHLSLWVKQIILLERSLFWVRCPRELDKWNILTKQCKQVSLLDYVEWDIWGDLVKIDWIVVFFEKILSRHCVFTWDTAISWDVNDFNFLLKKFLAVIVCFLGVLLSVVSQETFFFSINDFFLYLESKERFDQMTQWFFELSRDLKWCKQGANRTLIQLNCFPA